MAEGEPRIMVHQEEVVDTLGEVAAHTQTKQAGEEALTVVARAVLVSLEIMKMMTGKYISSRFPLPRVLINHFIIHSVISLFVKSIILSYN